MKDAASLIWDGYSHMEVTIGRPAKDVWPFFFGEKREVWSNKPVTTLAGKPGQVGQIHTMEHRGGRFFDTAIKVEPERLLVLKLTFKKYANAEERLVAYDIFTLNEVAGRTTVVLQQAFALPLEPEADLDLETEQHVKVLDGIFQNLKAMVESQ